MNDRSVALELPAVLSASRQSAFSGY